MGRLKHAWRVNKAGYTEIFIADYTIMQYNYHITLQGGGA